MSAENVLSVLHGRRITSIDYDETGVLLRCGSDCDIRINAPVHVQSGSKRLADFVGQLIDVATADELSFMISIGEAEASVRLEEFPDGVVEGVIVTTPSVIVVWP